MSDREQLHLREIARLDKLVAELREQFVVQSESFGRCDTERIAYKDDADKLRARVTALETALSKACSMLDDAVQLRDDADNWFPEIDKLRKVRYPNCICQCTYEQGDSRCEVHPGCNECGKRTERPADSCKEHNG